MHLKLFLITISVTFVDFQQKNYFYFVIFNSNVKILQKVTKKRYLFQPYPFNYNASVFLLKRIK